MNGKPAVDHIGCHELSGHFATQGKSQHSGGKLPVALAVKVAAGMGAADQYGCAGAGKRSKPGLHFRRKVLWAAGRAPQPTLVVRCSPRIRSTAVGRCRVSAQKAAADVLVYEYPAAMIASPCVTVRSNVLPLISRHSHSEPDEPKPGASSSIHGMLRRNSYCSPVYEISVIYGTPWSRALVNPAKSPVSKMSGALMRVKPFTIVTSGRSPGVLHSASTSVGKAVPPSLAA